MPSSTASPPTSQTETQATQTEQHYTLHCALQNRLGGLDRVLGALTHRGFIPSVFQAKVQDAQIITVSAQLNLPDAKTAEKLEKFLQKQVYVLSAQVFPSVEAKIAPQHSVTPLFQPHPVSEYAQRRTAHVHNG